MSYATVAQFFAWGLPQTALGARTVADVQSALDAASDEMDDVFRGRWRLPFVSWGSSVARKCVQIAVNIFLGGRGCSPITGSDERVIAGVKDAAEWLDRVQRRTLFPDVVLVEEPDALQQPLVISTSVVNADGATAVNRGW